MKNLTQEQRIKLAIRFPQVSKVVESHRMNEVLSKVNSIKGDKGDRGDAGQKGRDGVNGRDGKDGLSGRDGINGKDGMDGADGRDGKDGIDPVVDYERILSELKKEISQPKDGKDAVIDEAMIKKVLDPHVKELHGRIAMAIDGMPRGSNYGGFIETPIKAGSNVTVTKDGSGATVISSTGGGSSATWYEGEVVASNTTGTSFSLQHVPVSVVFLYKNGQLLTAGAGQDYTRSGGSITLAVSFNTADLLTATYS